jgi:uncharacterized protein YcfL
MRNAALVLMLVLAAACRREEPAPTATAPPQTTTVTSTAPTNLADAKVTATVALEREREVAERSRLGTKLDAEGNVSEDARTFEPGEKVHLTMWVRQSPVGLQTSAIWYDARGKKVHEERVEMKGAKVATFTFPKTNKPGKYRVEALWGGNKGAEYEFEVR